MKQLLHHSVLGEDGERAAPPCPLPEQSMGEEGAVGPSPDHPSMLLHGTNVFLLSLPCFIWDREFGLVKTSRFM